MLYEIINPSDPYTILAESLDVAFVACLFLGGGQYAFKPLNPGGVKIPLFIFGGAEEWALENLHEGLEAVVERVMHDPIKRAELAECFDQCLIGNSEDRATYQSGLDLIDDLEKRKEWSRQWHDKRRSSMNDIGRRAHEMAAKLRQGSQRPVEPVPPQVFTS